MEDLSELISHCRAELHRIGLTWKSERVLHYCEKVTGYRDAHYLNEQQVEVLLSKLQAELTAKTIDGAKWLKFEEESPVEAALMGLDFCNNWEDFIVLTESYGVDDSDIEKSEKFWQQVKSKGYEVRVNTWRREFLEKQKVA